MPDIIYMNCPWCGDELEGDTYERDWTTQGTRRTLQLDFVCDHCGHDMTVKLVTENGESIEESVKRCGD